MFGRTDPRLDLIGSVPLFVGCAKKELTEVSKIAQPIDYPAGRVLFRQGESGGECFIIVEGTVDVERDGAKLNTLGPGAMVGEAALVATMPRTATVTTTSPVELLLISATSFKRLVHDYPGIAVHVLDALGERIPTWIGNTTS